MADRDLDDQTCISCGDDLDDGNEEVGFCRACETAIADERENGPRCPYCRVAPCADPDGCQREASREERAERVRDGEG